MAGNTLRVARQILDLAGTMDEALTHMHTRQTEGHSPQEAMAMFADVIHGFAEIQEAMGRAFPAAQGDEAYGAATDSFQAGLGLLTDAYERADGDGALAVLGDAVRPRFAKWRGELERLLLPYVSS